MDKVKRRKLEARGWKFGDAAEFLGLSPEEQAFIETKLALSRKLKELRQRKKLSQEALAQLIHSSQSRVAKMEAGSASVSIDLIIKSILALGASRKDLARAISADRKAA